MPELALLLLDWRETPDGGVKRRHADPLGEGLPLAVRWEVMEGSGEAGASSPKVLERLR